MIPRRTLLCIFVGQVLAATLGAEFASAQATAQKQAAQKGKTDLVVRIPMRDGVKGLSSDLSRARSGKGPKRPSNALSASYANGKCAYEEGGVAVALPPRLAVWAREACFVIWLALPRGLSGLFFVEMAHG